MRRLGLRCIRLRLLRKRSKGESLKRLAQILLTAALAVGFVALPPAKANAPFLTHKQIVKSLEPKSYAYYLVSRQWKDHKKEYACLEILWQKESGWRSNAANPHSTAWGIPQFLNSTWVNYGYPIRPKDPQVQVKAGLRYIYKRYKTPCRAWDFWKKQAGPDLHGGWY